MKFRRLASLVVATTFIGSSYSTVFAESSLNVTSSDKRHSFSLSTEVSDYMYKELVDNKFFMSLSGTMYGLSAEYKYRFKHGMSKLFGAVQARYMYGLLTYDGGYNNTAIKFKLSNSCSWYFDYRSLFGKEIVLNDKFGYRPYFGFGFRQLFNDAVNFPGMYDRISRYYYLPIGIDIEHKCKNVWTFILNVEYDLFLTGMQTSDTPYLNRAVDNKQNSGYGLRVSGKVSKKMERVVLFIEPFFRYWHIDDSEFFFYVDYTDLKQHYINEPDNSTKEAGVKLGMTF